MTAVASGSSSVVAVLNPVNPSIATTSTASRQDSSRSLSHVLNACFERPWTMSSSRAGPVPSRMGVRSMITRDVLVAASGVAPHVLVDADGLHTVEPAGIIDQDPLALGQDRVVGGTPRHPETFGDPGDGQVLTHDALQRPPQTAPRHLRPGLGGQTGVLAPHMPASGAPVAAHGDFQRRGTPAQRLVRQPPNHGVPRGSLAAAAAAPAVKLNHPAGQDRTIGLEPLPSDFQTELLKPAERGQVRAAKGSVRHVEVFQMGSVRTPIIGRPRPFPAPTRRAPAPNGVAPSLHRQLRRAVKGHPAFN
jgi:hypothetical protein